MLPGKRWWRPARLAHAHEFIINLPLGYDTQVGERGSRLSGGEAQRIALARAFLKDAPVLILDEATSSLDPELEVRLQESITSLMKERTTLVIAHRLSTVYRADRIYVMEAGCIVESGSHSALMAREGLYHMMVGNYTGWESASALSDPGYVQRLKQRRGDAGTPADNPLPIHSMLADTEPRTDPAAANQGYTAEPGIRIFQRLLKLVLPYRNQIMLSVLLGVLTIGSGIGLMAASAYIISAAALGPSIAVLQVPIVGVRAFGISRGVFRYLERYISHRTTFLILSRLRVWFYQSLEPLAPARLDGYRGGDLLNRAIGDIASLESLYVRGLAPPLVALVVAVVTSLAMATFSPILGLNLLGFLLLTGAGVSLLGLQGSRSAGSQLVLTRGALSARLADGILGAADLLMSDQRCIHSRSVETLNQKAAAHHRKLASNEAVQSGMLTLLTNLGMWTSLLLAIPLVHAGQMDGVYLAVTALVVLTSFEAVLPLPQAALHLESNLEAAGRLFEVLDAQPEVIDPAQPADPPISAEIQITELSFRYPYPDQAVENMAQVGHAHQQPFALEDISLSLPAGKHMAVVGPSGAGKSTLVKLLLRYWDYRSGVINFGGRDLRDFSAEDVRQRLAVVEQNPYLFNTSIRHNLLIANPTAGEDELIRAARGAHIYEMIQSQPLGFDTLIGESGLRISGGERQRLAIARALLRRSSLLVLDEPSANLDPLVERQIMETVVDAMQGKTTLLITHRLVGLERMDEILVLDRGRIIERGRHYELLAAGGLYYRMWQTQNQIIGTN